MASFFKPERALGLGRKDFGCPKDCKTVQLYITGTTGTTKQRQPLEACLHVKKCANENIALKVCKQQLLSFIVLNNTNRLTRGIGPNHHALHIAIHYTYPICDFDKYILPRKFQRKGT